MDLQYMTAGVYTAMCNFETIKFRCGHTVVHRSAWCHHARNDPNHICSGVQVMDKKLREVENEDCNYCVQHSRQSVPSQQQHG